MDRTQSLATDDDDPAAVLRRYASRLNGRSWRWPLLPPSYDMLADALVWVDERPFGLPSAVACSLRVLWYHRTGLLLGRPRPYAEFWELGRRLFPRWVGFHPSRCRPSRKFTAIYRAGHIATIRCMAQVQREIDATGPTEGE